MVNKIFHLQLILPRPSAMFRGLGNNNLILIPKFRNCLAIKM